MASCKGTITTQYSHNLSKKVLSFFIRTLKVDRALGAASAKVELMRQLKLGMETTMPSALLEVGQISHNFL